MFHDSVVDVAPSDSLSAGAVVDEFVALSSLLLQPPISAAKATDAAARLTKVLVRIVSPVWLWRKRRESICPRGCAAVQMGLNTKLLRI